MDLVALEIFKAVAEHGGITRAAARLHRVASNVTTRVKQLEARLGTKLFLRQGRRLVLSAEGKVLLAYAERLLRLSSEARAALKSTAPAGLLRLGALESTAATRLPPILSRYHLAYPAVRVELVTGTTAALVQKVAADALDAAFVAEPFSAPGLETTPAFTEELVLVAPKSAGALRSPRDIGARPVLAFTAGCAYRRRLEAWLARASVVPHRVMEYGSYHAIVACAAAGGGVAVVPRAVLRALRAEEQVSVHKLPANVARAVTRLVWRRGHHASALDALRSALSAQGPAA